MEIRETINKNPIISASIAGAVILIALIFIISWLARSEQPPKNVSKNTYFTADDGATWFADDIQKEAPFINSDGKECFKAHVYRCGTDGQPHVAYIERMRLDRKRELDDAGEDKAARQRVLLRITMEPGNYEVKRPGANEKWYNRDLVMSDLPLFLNLKKCPDGSDPVEIFPD